MPVQAMLLLAKRLDDLREVVRRVCVDLFGISWWGFSGPTVKSSRTGSSPHDKIWKKGYVRLVFTV